jgi:hypothetical protein
VTAVYTTNPKITMLFKIEECRLLGHGATSQKTAFFIVTAVKTSNLF